MKLQDLKNGDILTEAQWQSVYKDMDGEYRIVTVPLINKDEYTALLEKSGLDKIVGDIPERTYSYCMIEQAIEKIDGQYKQIKPANRIDFLLPIDAKSRP